MKLYNFLFYRVYKSLSITNKSIPHWSTIFAISSIQMINVLSIFKYFDIIIESLAFKFLAVGLVIINFLIFLSKDRYHEIIAFYDNKKMKNKINFDIILIVYINLSIFIFFYLNKLNMVYSLILMSAITVLSLSVYLKHKLFNNKDL